MSDPITAKGSDAKFLPHPDGQFVATCVDTIDLGDNVETFAGKPPKLAHKCALVFRTGERNESTGEYIDISREFTVSMSEKANLRKFLEQWRGKPYQAAQIEEGVPLHKLTGQPALLTIAHKVSSQERTYANIAACVGVPKQMRDSVATHGEYVRADYWGEKKKTYAESARKFRGDIGQPADDDLDESQQYDEDDALPF
jgi:hypothetical protein